MPDEARIYRFGDVEVDTAEHRVTRGGRDLALEPKAYAVLLALLARPGYVVGRDELLDQVWGHRHVTPGVLNRAVAQLRKALGDDAEHPRYIQTLHAVGYRFMCVPEVSLHVLPVLEAWEMSHSEGDGMVPGGGGALMEAGGELFVIGNAADTAVHGGGVAAAAPDPASPGYGKRGAKAMLVTMLLLVFGLVVAAVAWWGWGNGWHPPSQAGPVIAIRPFSVLGGGEAGTWFADGLAIEMHDALASVPGLQVAALMPRDDTRRHEDVRALGHALSVDAILDASIRREGGRMRITARLSDTHSGHVLWSRSYEHPATEVFATQGAIASEVIDSLLGAMPEQRESLRRRLAPTRNLTAFDAYLLGLSLARGVLDRERSSRAAEAFRTAVAEDTGFARAQAALCTTETLRFEYWNDNGAYDRALAACARATTFDPVPPEAALALGNLHRVSGAFGQALAQFARAANDPATAAMAQIGIAKVHAARGEAGLAKRHFDQALALAPRNARVRAEVGYQAYRDGRMEEAIARYREALELDPDNAGNWNTYGVMHMVTGDTAEAARALERSVGIRPSADALANLGTLRDWAGDHQAALLQFRRALELDPDDYINWGNLAGVLRSTDAPPEETRKAFAEAERRVRRYLEIDPGDGSALAALGWYCANLGKRAEALEKVDASRGAARGDAADIALYNAETLAVLGEREASMKEIERARSAGMDEVRIRASAAWR